LKAWRIDRRKWIDPTPLNGEGARLVGGRWNSTGRSFVYCSASVSLAIQEVLVHLHPDEIPEDYLLLEFVIPDGVAEHAFLFEPRTGWKPEFPSEQECKRLGNEWYDKRKTALLRVQSFVVPEEHNLIVHAEHPDAARIRGRIVRPFALDARLIKS